MNKGFTVQVDKNANYLGEEDKGRTPGRIYGGRSRARAREAREAREVVEERAESGRNGGKLRSNTSYFTFEKGLNIESQEKGWGLGEQGTGGGGLDIPYPPPTIKH